MNSVQRRTGLNGAKKESCSWFNSLEMTMVLTATDTHFYANAFS